MSSPMPAPSAKEPLAREEAVSEAPRAPAAIEAPVEQEALPTAREAPVVANDVRFARLYPYNPPKGYVLRRLKALGTVWEGGVTPRWAKVTREQAEELESFQQDGIAADSLPAFQIVSDKKRLEIDAREAAAAAGAQLLASQQPALAALALGQRPPLDMTGQGDLTSDRVRAGRAAAIPGRG